MFPLHDRNWLIYMTFVVFLLLRRYIIWRLESLSYGGGFSGALARLAVRDTRAQRLAIIEASFTRIHIHNWRKMGIIVSVEHYSRYTVNAFRT